MKQKYGFILFENLSEFATWLKKQKKYGYTGIQEHHMYQPSYKNWKEDPLVRQKNIKDFHINTNHWGDIAQHFSTFPDGSIVTGRSLSKTTAIGIKGWNTKKICIENYGDFDSGHDVMTTAQKNTIIALTALLCEHEGITPSTSTIKYHCWFTAGGVYLGDFDKYKSCKTCPGTSFFGGNTKAKMKANFLPLVKKYINDKSITITPAPTPAKDSDEIIPNGLADKEALVVGCEKLNVRKNRPDKDGNLASVVDTVASGTRVTIGYVADGWASIFYVKDKVNMSGFVNVKYLDLIEETKKETATPITNGDYDAEATVVCKTSLNVRETRPDSSGTLADVIDTIPNGTKVTLGYVYQNWGSIFYIKDGKTKSGFVNVKYLKIG